MYNCIYIDTVQWVLSELYEFFEMLWPCGLTYFNCTDVCFAISLAYGFLDITLANITGFEEITPSHTLPAVWYMFHLISGGYSL